MTSLEDLAIAGLIYSIKVEKDTKPLIKWLHAGGTVTQELGELIADILAGKLKASPKQTKTTSIKRRPAVYAELKYHQENLTQFKGQPTISLGDGTSLSWADMQDQLKRAGYAGDVYKKGEITKAAEHLTTHSRRITPAQLNEILRNRKRKKPGKK